MDLKEVILSFYNGVEEWQEIEVWPVLSLDEVKTELIEQLDDFTQDEIEDGITVSIDYIDRETNKPKLFAHLHTSINSEKQKCIEYLQEHGPSYQPKTFGPLMKVEVI